MGWMETNNNASNSKRPFEIFANQEATTVVASTGGAYANRQIRRLARRGLRLANRSRSLLSIGYRAKICGSPGGEASAARGGIGVRSRTVDKSVGNRLCRPMPAFGGKADMTIAMRNVRCEAYTARRTLPSSAVLRGDSGIRSPMLRYGLKRFLRLHAWSHLPLLPPTARILRAIRREDPKPRSIR
jgi:hypothetical protein